MKLDIFNAEMVDACNALKLDNAALGDLACFVDLVLDLPTALRDALRHEAGGVVGDKLPVRVLKLVPPAQIGDLMRKKQLQAIVGEVVE